MKGFAADIEDMTVKNTDYRRVVYTSAYTQLVLMSLKPGEEIGNEIHGLDQFLQIEEGKAKIVLNHGETEYTVEDDWAVLIPAGIYHNVINTGDEDLKLYTLYSPPSHQKDTVHPTKADEKEDHFDGTVSETK